MPKVNEIKIPLGTGFSPRHGNPLDDRLQFTTIEEMVTFPETSLYDGCIGFNLESRGHYVFDSNNEDDPDLHKWRSLQTGTGGDGGEEIIPYTTEEINALINEVFYPTTESPGDITV